MAQRSPRPQGLQKKRPSDVQTALLRQHLLELTQGFIIPLVRPGRRAGGRRAGGAGSRPRPRLRLAPFPPRSTTWPASCPCRRASRPGRCGPGRGWEDGPYADPLVGVQEPLGPAHPHTRRWPSQGREMRAIRMGEGLEALFSGKGHPGICPCRVGAGRHTRGPSAKCPGEGPDQPRCGACEAVPPPPQHPGSPSPCLRPLPRSTPSARMTSCVAWSAQGPSSPASSRATGWASTGGWTVGRVLGPLLLVAMPIPQHTASAHTCCPLPPTGGFSSPPILMAGTDSGTKRWPRSWRPCTSRPSVRR